MFQTDFPPLTDVIFTVEREKAESKHAEINELLQEGTKFNFLHIVIDHTKQLVV